MVRLENAQNVRTHNAYLLLLFSFCFLCINQTSSVDVLCCYILIIHNTCGPILMSVCTVLIARFRADFRWCGIRIFDQLTHRGCSAHALQLWCARWSNTLSDVQKLRAAGRTGMFSHAASVSRRWQPSDIPNGSRFVSISHTAPTRCSYTFQIVIFIRYIYYYYIVEYFTCNKYIVLSRKAILL